MKPLSDEILSTAFHAKNGDYGWHLEDIEPALRAIAASGQATIGGQAWIVENGKIIAFYPGVTDEAGEEFIPSAVWLRIWDVGYRNPEESWAEYCRRALDESLREIKASESDGVVPIEHRDRFYINPTYVEEFDVQALVPRDKHDHARAAAAIAAGYPAVEPILPGLLQCLQDMNWPVAQDLAPFLTEIGPPLIPHIRKIFETDDLMWKYWIIGTIIAYGPDVAAAFRDDLVRIAHSPTERESEGELHEQALWVLEQYGWER